MSAAAQTQAAGDRDGHRQRHVPERQRRHRQHRSGDQEPAADPDQASAEQRLDLAALVEPVRSAGITVDLVETGPPIPAVLRPAVSRVIQKALTNVVKHAAAGTVTVTVVHDAAGVRVEVLDDGSGAAHPMPGGGRGITGMAERLRAHGGMLHTERLTPHGFRVLAHLPAGAP